MSGVSHTNNKKMDNYKGSPPQGLSEARRDREVYALFFSPEPPRGGQSGAAAFIANGGYGSFNPHNYAGSTAIFRKDLEKMF
jgi:hypothetical protein